NCSRFFIATFRSYTTVHRYICAIICIYGIFANSIHFHILTRKDMRSYAVNGILSVIAVNDAVIMTSYLIYIFRFRIFDNDGYKYWWLVFLLTHVTLSISLHTVELYLTVIVAYIRWMALERLDTKWLRTKLFFSVFGVILTLSIPTLLVHKIVPVENHLDTSNTTVVLYTVVLDSHATEHSCRLFKATLWLTGIFFKVIPCILILWFTIALMCRLNEKTKARAYLLGNRTQKDRTTAMLVTMLTVFLCTELPQGGLAILNALYTADVSNYIYTNVGEVMDLLSLINCNVGFILYSCMSSRYRSTFKETILNPVYSILSSSFSKTLTTRR
uniref:G_PROTEIN_RECEP_F1_2 domain-containing protein n=1 Tax=Syphacia muris TaxID=451379 RepID=A0A0N5APN0_9BILA